MQVERKTKFIWVFPRRSLTSTFKKRSKIRKVECKTKEFILFFAETEYLRPLKKVKGNANWAKNQIKQSLFVFPKCSLPSRHSLKGTLQFVNIFQLRIAHFALRIAKPMLLPSKRLPFALQNMTFHSPKPKLLQSKTSRIAFVW